MRVAALAAAALMAALMLPSAAKAVYLFEPTVVGTSPNGPVEVGAGDFDGDGFSDLVTLTEASTDVEVRLGGPGGTFAEPVGYASGSVAARGVVIADFNGDGDPDIAKSAADINNLSILLGDGAPGGLPPGGGFEEPITYETAAASAGIAAGDFDGDDDLDLAVTDVAAGRVDVLRGKGDGTFKKEKPLCVADPRDVEVGDFNSDGDPDLAVSTNGPDVAIFKGTPGPKFFRSATLTGGSGQLDISSGDVNADADTDLVVANSDDDTASLFLGEAGTAFGDARNLAVGDNPHGSAVRDFDLDGDQDLAVANLDSNDVSILANQGTGDLSPAVNFASGATPAELLAGDFGGDAHPDLVVLNVSAGEISLLLGGSDPSAAFKARVVVEPVSGTVRYQCPGGPVLELTALRELPLNCIIFASDGRVRLTTADEAGAEQTAEFYGGDFRITQVVEGSRARAGSAKAKKKKKGRDKGPRRTVTVLSLYGKIDCSDAKSGAARSGPVAQASARKRGLWGSGKGKFRTKGSQSSATIRGTIWNVTDTCNGTLTQVTEGSVTVRDFTLHRTVIVRAGDTYLAPKAKPRRAKKR
jgi:FG-GAP-like repeat